MNQVENFDLGNGNEARVGIDYDFRPPCVSLALNHFEDNGRWGGQPLTPEEATKIANSLLKFAEMAKKADK